MKVLINSIHYPAGQLSQALHALIEMGVGESDIITVSTDHTVLVDALAGSAFGDPDWWDSVKGRETPSRLIALFEDSEDPTGPVADQCDSVWRADRWGNLRQQKGGGDSLLVWYPGHALKSGACLIADERRRQIAVEDFPAEWDDKYHTSSELTEGAICYATVAADQVAIARAMTKVELEPTVVAKLHANAWPEERFQNPDGDDLWRLGDWKPSDDPIRNLVKAGALIAAEIDRLQRLKSTTNLQQP